MSKDYDEIKVLKNLAGIRATAEMYLGNTQNGDAIQQMLLELISNSIDEYMSGYATKLIVCLHKDGSCSVEDNGRGIPTSWNHTENASNLELAVGRIHAGGKFSGAKSYNTSGGLHGVGSSCCNACSVRFRPIVWRDGNEYTMLFEKGEKVEELSSRPVKRKQTGTLIRFVPDRSLFKNVLDFDGQRIYAKLRELSYLCQGLIIEYINEKENIRETLLSTNGLSDFVKELSPSHLLGQPIGFSMEIDNITVDAALQWSSQEQEIVKYYTNNIPNLDGGSHQAGWRSGLTRTLNNYIDKTDLPKTQKVSLDGADVREGLVAVVSIKHPNPSYSSQTKDKLVSDDTRKIVESVVSDRFGAFLEQNPEQTKKIISRVINSYRARQAAKKAREAIRKTAIDTGGAGILPGKLADCESKDPDECELFICEGISAGGGLKGGRDRKFQAVLPLRGKVLNTEKCEYKKMLDNEELQNIIIALGCGFGKSFNINKLRYGKILITTDGDVDGSHIRTLLLTFFFRQMPQLIMNGNIYVSQPPLYRVDMRGEARYFKNDEELNTFLKGRDRKSVKLSYFKGLGELSQNQIWDTITNPDNRTILQVKVGSYVEADKVFSLLMGTQVEPRKNYIMENSGLARNIDV